MKRFRNSHPTVIKASAFSVTFEIDQPGDNLFTTITKDVVTIDPVAQWRLIDRGAARLLMPPENFRPDLAAAGLTPGGEDGGWFQRWRARAGPEGETLELRNLIGLVPGSRAGRGPW